jgi:EAL domain-containing protein (putative c-di-GMP-specific phosphodiesterase class I)
MSAKSRCQGCGDGASLDFDFTMAFHPIIHAVSGRVWGYEALVRGRAGEGAGPILSRVDEANRYKFDQACRVRAIELAGKLFPRDESRLSINFMPNAVYEPTACIRASLAAANRVGFDPKRLMFEFTENERIADTAHVQNIIEAYRRMGFTTALDDFGAGYAGLTLLANFRPDLIKIDMELVRGIEASPARQAIVASIAGLCRELGIDVIAEGVETRAEFLMLRSAGIGLFQGFLFARPALESLPVVEFALAA